jgi:hypothetical protein
MLEVLFVLSIIIFIITIGLAVVSIKVINIHAFKTKMYVYLGVVYLSLLVMGVAVLLLMIYLGWPASSFIPPAFILVFPIFITTPTVLLVLIIQSIRTYIKSNKNSLNNKFHFVLAYLINAILFPVFFISIPSIIASPIGPNCEYKNQDTGEQIVKAIENYHETRIGYPESLNNLVPEFLSSIPKDHCDLFDLREYRIAKCSNEIILLTIETMPRDQYQRYDIKNDRWSVSPSPVGDWYAVDEWDTICDDLE